MPDQPKTDEQREKKREKDERYRSGMSTEASDAKRRRDRERIAEKRKTQPDKPLTPEQREQKQKKDRERKAQRRNEEPGYKENQAADDRVRYGKKKEDRAEHETSEERRGRLDEDNRKRHVRESNMLFGEHLERKERKRQYDHDNKWLKKALRGIRKLNSMTAQKQDKYFADVYRHFHVVDSEGEEEGEDEEGGDDDDGHGHSGGDGTGVDVKAWVERELDRFDTEMTEEQQRRYVEVMNAYFGLDQSSAGAGGRDDEPGRAGPSGSKDNGASDSRRHHHHHQSGR